MSDPGERDTALPLHFNRKFNDSFWQRLLKKV